MVPASGVSCQNGNLFPPDLTNFASCVDIETPPHRDPLADLFDSDSSLRHSLFTEKSCVCETAQAWFLPITVTIFKFLHIALICAVDAPCAVRPSIDLNRVDARHCDCCAYEFILHRRLTLLALRLPFQMRFHWFAAHLLFSTAVLITRSVAAVPRQIGTPSAPRWLTINFLRDCRLPEASICKTGLGPAWLCRLPLLCRSAQPRVTIACDSYSSQMVTDHRCALRKPIQEPRTPLPGPI